MLIRLAAVFLLLWPVASMADTFQAARLSADNKALQVTTTHGGTLAAPALPDQVEFGSPRISPDGSN